MSKEMTLLEKAKQFRVQRGPHRVIKSGEIEVAIAWMKDEISQGQAAFALGEKTTTGNILYRICVLLREGYRRNLIKT